MSYQDIADRLREIGSELDDASFALLHDAAADGATARPDADRILTQARRAVEKAIALLERVDSGAAADDEMD